MAQNEENKIQKIKVSVVSPHGSLFAGEVDSLIVPGKNGILGIYPGHTKIVSLLREGTIALRRSAQSEEKIDIDEGLIQVNRNSVEMLVSQKDENKSEEQAASA